MDLKQKFSMVTIVIALIIFAAWSIFTYILYRRRNKSASKLFFEGSAVIAFCCIAAMILLPIYAGSLPVPHLKLKTDAKQIATALTIYCSDYDDRLPPTTNLSCLSPYIKHEILEGLINQKNPKIVMNANLPGQKLEPLMGELNIPLIYRTEPLPSGDYIVAFTNTEVRLVSAGEWDMIKRKMAKGK